MTTASITHRPIPMATAAAAAVAALAIVGLVVVQNETGSAAGTTQQTQLQTPDYHRPMHGGVQPGMP